MNGMLYANADEYEGCGDFSLFARETTMGISGWVLTGDSAHSW